MLLVESSWRGIARIQWCVVRIRWCIVKIHGVDNVRRAWQSVL